MSLSVVGSVHMAAASISLLTGAFQLTRRKGGKIHRRVGYTYVGAMLVNNITALFVYQFTGHFNVFHGFAIYSLFSVAMAIRPMLVRPRPVEWLLIHYQWVAWSYVGLMAAAVTEFLVRVVLLPGWLSAAVGSPFVVGIGAWLIYRSLPKRAQPVSVAK